MGRRARLHLRWRWRALSRVQQGQRRRRATNAERLSHCVRPEGLATLTTVAGHENSMIRSRCRAVAARHAAGCRRLHNEAAEGRAEPTGVANRNQVPTRCRRRPRLPHARADWHPAGTEPPRRARQPRPERPALGTPEAGAGRMKGGPRRCPLLLVQWTQVRHRAMSEKCQRTKSLRDSPLKREPTRGGGNQ
jgi:hypothetical protein